MKCCKFAGLKFAGLKFAGLAIMAAGAACGDGMGVATGGGAGGAGGAGGGTGGGGDGGGSASCSKDQDCMLHSDCCSCYPHLATMMVSGCKSACTSTRCELDGVQSTRCLRGACVAIYRCRESAPPCPTPPVCPGGQLPVLGPVAGSMCLGGWTGSCAPVEQCDAVPRCDVCGAANYCVAKNTGSSMGSGSTELECRPLPSGCGARADCACVAQPACPFGGQCDTSTTGITCAIPGS